jgi:hypothetical protein
VAQRRDDNPGLVVMKKYDPDIAPDPVAWLAMSEG